MNRSDDIKILYVNICIQSYHPSIMQENKVFNKYCLEYILYTSKNTTINENPVTFGKIGKTLTS